MTSRARSTRLLIATLLLGSATSCNQPPVIGSFSAPDSAYPRTERVVSCTADDPEDDPFSLTWMCTRGTLTPDTGFAVSWHSPESAGTARVTVRARDTHGGVGSYHKDIAVTSAAYGDRSFYRDVAWGIVGGLEDIYNQNVVGTPVGNVDLFAYGPFGGTVRIAGSTSWDQTHGITTVHLRYDMSDCRVVGTTSSPNLNEDLTLNGTVSEDGFWSSTDFELSYNSDALHVNGTSKRDSILRDIDDTTTFKATRTNSGTSAELFGFSVSWEPTPGRPRGHEFRSQLHSAGRGGCATAQVQPARLKRKLKPKPCGFDTLARES